jgi:hypothetical protein
VKKIRPIARPVVALTLACLTVVAVLTGAGTAALEARHGRVDRGALTLEQAIITAVLSGAAIALAIVVGNAILSHSANIR